ncbi:hypothetical protein E4T56_gene20497 [Termitomyces sp. T112]|nr:hypothetical protein E4T56_gene20497 [Termitomyces sp. T112]
MMVKNCYPLPLISELINNLWGAQYFTKLNIWWGYNNMCIQEGDEWKAAFWTNWGLFKPLVMFFGLTNSPTTFQTMMNNIFWDLIAEGIWYHLLCPGTPLLAPALPQAGEVTAEMDPVKVAGMAEWLEPKNKKKVQAFLGFANFYWRFIQDFSHHAHPLFDLTGKDVPWSWGLLEQTAFDTLKCTVTSRPVLLFSDDNSSFQVEANCSDFATGAMLSQQSLEDGKWHPVAFYSKSLNAVEWNYKIHDKEMLAIIQSFEKWQHILEGAQHKFEVWADHKNLKYFQTAKKLNCQQAWWSLYLANFDFSLHHKPGPCPRVRSSSGHLYSSSNASAAC